MTDDPVRDPAESPPPSPVSVPSPSAPPQPGSAAPSVPVPARPGLPRPAGSSRPDQSSHGGGAGGRGRSAPGGGRDGHGRGPGPARPTPVRDAVNTAAREPLRPVERSHRTIRGADGEWIVCEGGLAGSGTGSGPRAPLLLLFFAPATEPDRVTLELLVPARRLADLADDALVAALEAARPCREDRARHEIFPDTRKRGSKGL